MDVSSAIFLAIFMVLSLAFGVSGFIGNKTRYSSYAARPLFAGVLLLLFFVVGFFNVNVETQTYLLSYACFGVGAVFLICGIAIALSKKVSDFWWRLVHRKEQKDDRKNLVIVALVLSFGFFFAFFLFYPPFLSIG